MRSLFVACALLVAMGNAGADTNAATELARKQYKAGEAEFTLGRYAVALEHFNDAYARAPFPDLLFDIGRCHEELGHYKEAIAAYERFTIVAPNQSERVHDRIVALAGC